MNWDAIGAVGEIVGATAVVVSLVYLALQIRTQNRQARIAAMHDISVGFRESTAKFVDSDVADIFVRGNHDLDSLTETETLRLILSFAVLFRVWEEAFVQHHDGNLDGRSWKMISRYYQSVLGAPSSAYVWSVRKQQFDPEFREYVDSLPPLEYSIKAPPNKSLETDT